jgi:hypothetical protein
MASALQPARVLWDPVDGVAPAVEARRWVLPLGALMLATCAAAVAWFFRWDASSKVVGDMLMSGDLARNTEREIAEATQTAERVALVGGLAKGLLVVPLQLVAVAVALKVTGWFVGRKVAFAKAFTAGAVGLLPIALYWATFTAVALAQHGVTEGMREHLVPSSLAALFTKVPPPAARALATLDFFNLWSAALLGLGFAEASGMRKGRGVAVGLLLYALYAGIFLIGLPGMSGGGGRGESGEMPAFVSMAAPSGGAPLGREEIGGALPLALRS